MMTPHWWEPIGTINWDTAGRLTGPQINASRVLFNAAHARGAVVHMEHGVRRDTKVDEPWPE